MKITDNHKLKTSKIMNQLRAKFDVYSYWNDEELDKNFPPPKKTTTREFKDNVEADEEHKNKSALDLEKEGIQGITLRERLLMELKYFNKTGNHLDIENVTLCSGSRYSVGGVPGVYWDSDYRKVYVVWGNQSHSSSNLRARAVVSVPLSSESCTLESAISKVKEAGYLIYKQI